MSVLAFARWFSSLGLVLWLCGCDRQVAPPLVELTELLPSEVEPGDRLEIHGTGFPQGRTGKVTFEGAVSRPGEGKTLPVTVEVEGTVRAPDRLEVVVREALAERFCGRGDHAAHGTFRGNVEISFASNTPDAPPLVGRARNVVLDVQPASVRATVIEDRVREGGNVLRFLGITAGGITARGVPVEAVLPDSLAERAQIQVGDVISGADGVRVLALADIVPASARSIELTVRHGDSGTEEQKTLPLVEYASGRIPTEYAPALVIVGLAIAILILLVLPGPTSLAAVEMRIASSVRAASFSSMLGALFGEGRKAVVSALVSALVAAFALTPWVFGREVDGVVVLAASMMLLLWSCVAPERGFVPSLRTLLQTSLAGLALVGASLLTVTDVGAIELSEIVRTQGGAPWQFVATRHPSGAVTLCVYAASIAWLLRVRARQVASQTPLVDGGSAGALLEQGGLVLASMLGVALFLGGWQVPGAGEGHVKGALIFVSAFVFVAKTWGFAALLRGASRVLPSHTPRAVVGRFLRRGLPGLVVASALVLLSRRWAPSAALETAFGATLVALASLFVLRLVARVRAAVSRPEPHASPFL